MQLTCPYCNKQLSSKKYKYCSAACYRLSQAYFLQFPHPRLGRRPRRRTGPLRACSRCGRYLPTKNAKYCSWSCYGESRPHPRKPEIIELILRLGPAAAARRLRSTRSAMAGAIYRYRKGLTPSAPHATL